MADTLVACPTCRLPTFDHCENPQCEWAWCPKCKKFGDPDRGRWIQKDITAGIRYR